MSAIAIKDVCNQETLYEIVEPTDQELDALFKKAKAAWLETARFSLPDRIDAVKQLMQVILDKREYLVEKIMEETGKCRTDALVSEILGVLDYCEFIITKSEKILSDKKVSTPLTLMGKKSKIYHESLGVVLIIAPWNYPLHTAITSMVAAFVAGNSVLYKPSEYTPLKGVLEELFSCSPLLSQAMNIVYGSGDTAARLIAMKPAKVFFTGSVNTGKSVLKQAADLLIPVELELGGKDAMIVFNDVNIERTVSGAAWGALTNAGQSCSSVEKIYVHESIQDKFVGALKSELKKLTLNSGDLGNAAMGSLTTERQLKVVKEQVDDAVKKGATIHLGGECMSEAGLFYLPTLITGVKSDMKLMQEETFGPLLVVMPFYDVDEVIEAVNSSPFGLSASVWTRDLTLADSVARRLEVGAVSINNVMLTEGNPALPFGGTKSSGFGRSKGAEGLLGFTRSKSILVDQQSKKIEANWYPYTTRKYQLFNAFIDALFSKGPLRLIRTAIRGLSLESYSQKP